LLIVVFIVTTENIVSATKQKNRHSVLCISIDPDLGARSGMERSVKGVYQSHVACALLWLQSSGRHYLTLPWPFREGPAGSTPGTHVSARPCNAAKIPERTF